MSDTQFAKVAVLGAGTMGAGIAQVCAQSGSQVVLQDITDEFVSKGLQRVSAFLQKGVDRGKVTEETRDQVLARIVTTTDRAEAAREADLVVEAVPEKLELKNGLFRELADVVSEACVLGSNTSSLSLAKVFDGVSNPGRCIGMHFFNPVPVMQLLEIVRALQTSDVTYNAACEVADRLNKTRVTVSDSPGFVVNRILLPMINEAVLSLAEGLATAEELDAAMRLGANHPMGPLALADLIGLDVCLYVMETLYEQFGDSKYRPAPLLRKMVDARYLGRKTGRGFFTYG